MNSLFVSTLVFLAWPQITIEQIKEPVPIFEWSGFPGSVQSREWRTSKPAESCPEYDEAGRVIGFSLACKK